MQSPDTTDTSDAPIVPYIDADEPDATLVPDGGPRGSAPRFDRPPWTDHASAYTRDEEEIEPFVADLR